ncbi:MAG: hypothetical protein HC921_05805 [Synechococcaceae cyanobacterium SM2_3_1]|nr:hypothetical protein [Synechococcaceae cyanobacterium SM2_3_1]
MHETDLPLNAIFPRSVLSLSREQFGPKADNPYANQEPLVLRFTENSKLKELPSDLRGSVYMVGPAGSIDSPLAPESSDPYLVDPTREGTIMLYNGDGMIYRLDFDQPQQGVVLTTRLATPPDYIADAVTHTCPQYQDLKFESIGITRIGSLGLRNQLNTAFLPMKFAHEDRTRLLLTWDMGRPYEIDPVTLELATPMGWNHEWETVTELVNLPFEPKQPFQAIQTCAHPYFDPHQENGLVLTTNVGRSLSNLFSQIIPIGYLIKEGIRDLLGLAPPAAEPPSPFQDTEPEAPEPTAAPGSTSPQPRPASAQKPQSIREWLKELLVLLIQLVRGFLEFFSGNFVDLVMWDGIGNLQKWRITYQGRPIGISQTTHQIGVTEDYVLIADTAFKISIEELLPSLKSGKAQGIERAIRDLLDHPQLSYCPLYIVSRRDLQSGVSRVAARKVMIPWESAHFLTEYKNPQGQITIHFSFVCGWDAGEAVSAFDYEGVNAPKPTPGLPPLYGVLYGPTDISRLGYYVIQGETGEILDHDYVADTQLTWGPAIYAYPYGQNYASTPDQLPDLYWICLGCWRELLLPHILELYRDYPNRMIALSLIEKMTEQGRPSNLLHLHYDPEAQGLDRLRLVDAYAFPDGHYVLTPQFIPKRETSGSKDGYIVCLVHFGDRTLPTKGNEIWIFDAQNLGQGPICQLWHPQFQVGFTVHSTWLENPQRRAAEYYIPVQEDYHTLVKQQSQEVQDLFEDWIYPGKIPMEPGDC